MKGLKFKPHLVASILQGAKTVTWRLFDDKDLQTGDRLKFFNAETGEKFCDAVVTETYEKNLGEIGETDFEKGHERYVDPEAMLQEYRKYYPQKEVNWDTEVKMVRFNVIQ